MNTLDVTSAGGARFLVSPVGMVTLVIAVGFVMPFARWAGERLWENVTGKQRADAEQISALATEVRSGFQTLRDLIGAHNADLRELTTRVKHLEGEVERLREDRHELSNQVQALTLARKAAP